MARTNEQQELISDEEVELVNKFRDLCSEIVKRNSYPANATTMDAYDNGIVRTRADIAEHAAFQMLNHIDSYKHSGLSDDQMHNRKNED
jgi:hypothetical protein